jgi:flavin reductase (DIM6/NTAB) family NADH-FMN oxidoreductase RutF
MTAIEARNLRDCLGRFATGVTVLTYTVDGEVRGITVNAFSSISLDPPLVLVSVARNAKAAVHLAETPFCVNVLNASQVGTALAFAGRPSDRPVDWVDGNLVPRLAASHAWLECTPWNVYDGGDHVLILGEVQNLAFDDSEPLLFYSGGFRGYGEPLDEAGVPRRLAARRVTPPLHQRTVRSLSEEFVAGWI